MEVEALAQPDITYAPDPETYQARVTRRTENEILAQGVPRGFPLVLDSDLVWDGETLKDKYNWVYQLGEEHLTEVNQALAHFESLFLPLGHVTQHTFPLPTLHKCLRRLSDELHTGHGFFVLRGIQPQNYTRSQNIIIYTGIASHIAPTRGRQDHKFNDQPADVVLAHITDLSEGKDSAVIGSPAYTTDKQVFHTDTGDIVSLYALETAPEGGTSKLASTWQVYNHLASHRPDLIHTLSQPWPLENFSSIDSEPYTLRPLLFHQPATWKAPERIVLQYARRYFVGFGALSRNPEIPPISEAQAEALDALHFLGEEFCVGTDLQKGDMQFVNNLAVFHARDGFRDTPEKKRHLLRFWLRDPENAWETPPELQDRWSKVYDDVTKNQQILPLEPYIRSESNKSGSKDSEKLP